MNWWTLIVLLLGGLAMFLYGMNVMTDGLKAIAGNRMKTFLGTMTKNRWTSLLAGTGITAVIQSSSVTTVLAVGFVSAGLLSFQSTLGLILGANLGTTITAQIIAFKITSASWIIIAFGFMLNVLVSKKMIKDIGSVILGLGMVFLGMSVMSDATSPLKTYEPFIEMMQGMDNYFLAILIGTVFTAAVQSSSATTGVVIVLASQGLMGVETGIAIILGANVGTCVTAVLSAFGKPRAAMHVALSHILFNLGGVLIWIGFIDQLGAVVEGISKLDMARQIANAHTIFNAANTLIFIGLVGPISKLVVWLYPEKVEVEEKMFPELHSYYLKNPSTALDLSHAAIRNLGKETIGIIENGLTLSLEGNINDLQLLRKSDSIIDRGHAEILHYIQQIQGLSISERDVDQLEKQIEAVNILELAADLITTNLVEAAEHRIENGFVVSEETHLMLSDLHDQAIHAFRSALRRYYGKTIKSKHQISKVKFKEQFQDVRSHLMQRLAAEDQLRISIFRFESEVLETIRGLHALARRFDRRG